MRVSVVIPAHDAAATLAVALDSALAQDWPAAEIVVVDDGSSDETFAIAAAYARHHEQVRVVRQERGGPSAARNAAIAMTTGELVAPLDADDWWHPSYLRACVDALTEAPAAGFAWAWHGLFDGQGRRIAGPMRFSGDGGCFGALLLANFVGCGSAAVFRRDALEAAGGYEPPSPHWPGAEDYWLQLRVAARRPVAQVSRELVAYRRHAGSLSGDGEGVQAARLAALDRAIAELAADGLPMPVRRWVASDASRVRAVAEWKAGRRGAAIGPALRGFLGDPAGGLGDLGLRLANALARVRASGAVRERGIDGVLLRRMARLSAAMPYGRAGPMAMVEPHQPSMRPSNCAA